MNEAIKLAIKGGWKSTIPALKRGSRLAVIACSSQLQTAAIRPDSDRQALTVYWDNILLDPLFWQALGKALGWDGGNLIDPTYSEARPGTWMWQHQWRRFIDHLAERKDADSFFQELLRKEAA